MIETALWEDLFFLALTHHHLKNWVYVLQLTFIAPTEIIH